MRPLILALLIVGASAGFAQAPAPPVATFSNPPTLSTPTGYTHVVQVRGGRTIYIAGQVALDPQGNVVGKGDFRAQADKVFQNLRAALESAGASFKDVVKMNTYVVDAGQTAVLREVRAKYLASPPPANTLVQIGGLAREEFLLEIEAIAVVPEPMPR